MKVTVCFDNVRVVVPCGDGTLLVRDLMHEAILRYRKATGKNDAGLTINSLSSLTEGGLLDPDDRLCDVADDREQIVAHFTDTSHAGGDGASSVGTNSPDFFHPEAKEHRRYATDSRSRNSGGNIKRESVKRLSMHALSTREPHLTAYSALSLPRESRRREPLGQDAKAAYEFSGSKVNEQGELREIVIKNEAGALGLHVVPCYDLLGNDQGLRVEGIEPNGRIAKDGQIDLHDKIIMINGHNLLHIPFSKVQEIFRSCMSDPCLQISVIKHKKKTRNEKNVEKNISNNNANDKTTTNELDENVKKLQSNYNLLQNANTRKIGRMIDIELTKGSNGLGFSVTTRDNPAGGHCPIYIKNILPKGAAVEDGRLRPGDRLLEVNGVEMTGKSQAEVVSLLRNIPPGGKVRMMVSRQEEISANTSSESNVALGPTNRETSPDNSRLWNSLTPQRSPTKTNYEMTDSKSDNRAYDKSSYKNEEIVLSPRKNRMILTLDIPVHDSEKAGLGVSVKGKTSSADENTNMDLGIFIKSVLHGGAASRDGRLRTNDQLLNVNGVSLLRLSNSDAMETLRRAMLNTNSSVTGVITLTIARRVSSYEANNDKSFMEVAPSGCKLESANSIYISDASKPSEGGRINEINSLNSQTDILENGASILSPSSSASPWNPVIDRLTEQYNKNSLRNESYCLATNKTWLDSVGNVKKMMLGNRDDNIDNVLLEESPPANDNSHGTEAKKLLDDKESQYSGDPTYDSQLSLEELNASGNKFSRDALGRQSMSEKRHAALDAKNTDTYKRNKKLREGRDGKSGDAVDRSDDAEDSGKRSGKVEDTEKIVGKGTSGESSSFEDNRKRSDKKNADPAQSEYVYTIPGCNNKFLSPRKHWLVDDDHADHIPNSANHKEDREGFSNSRGDVKQASLNSALDDRYKRSRKKGGIRSMLRLGKNRKSLNFGDNIENRHETSNYCSAARAVTIPRSLVMEQKRFRAKINIQKPRKLFYERALVTEFVTPFYPDKKPVVPIWERCKKVEIAAKVTEEQEPHPYQRIIARECLQRFNDSKMIGFLHKNSMSADEEFELAVELNKVNMKLKYYGRKTAKFALAGTRYEAVLPLFCAPGLLVFSPEPNTEALRKIVKKTPQVTLLAGILHDKLLNVNDFLKYGKMDLTEARSMLVHTMQTAGGMNLNRQLTQHQTTFVSRLQQIGKNDGEATKEEAEAAQEAKNEEPKASE